MKSHPTDPVSLVFGILFTVLAAAFVAVDITVVNLDGRWVWPIVLIVAGLALLAPTRARKTRDGRHTGVGDSPPDVDPDS